MINVFFTAGSGTIDFPEFLTIMVKKLHDNDTEEQLREAFKVFDKNGDGFITAAEVRHVLAHVGEKVPNEVVDNMRRVVDVLGDGQINYEGKTCIQSLSSRHLIKIAGQVFRLFLVLICFFDDV